MSQEQHPITPPPPHLLKKFSAQAQDEAKKRNGAGYLKTFATLCIEWAMNSKTTPNDRQIRSSEITPPPELVYQWRDSGSGFDDVDFATQAARWGADQELEACIKLLTDLGGDGEMIRRYRRPKPPSLKEQALDSWDRLRNEAWCEEIDFDLDFIRRALEALPD